MNYSQTPLIVRIFAPAHANSNTVRSEQSSIPVRCVLHGTIGMMHEPVLMQRHKSAILSAETVSFDSSRNAILVCSSSRLSRMRAGGIQVSGRVPVPQQNGQSLGLASLFMRLAHTLFGLGRFGQVRVITSVLYLVNPRT